MADEEIDLEAYVAGLPDGTVRASYRHVLRELGRLTQAVKQHFPLSMGKGDNTIDTAITLIKRCHQLEQCEITPITKALRGVPKTASELEAIVAGELTKILGSNIHAAVWDRRLWPTPFSGDPGSHQLWYELTFPELEANVHLYERLGIANAALGALKGYTEKPRGFVLDRSLPDLAKKTGWIQGEDLAQMIAADSVKVGVDPAEEGGDRTVWTTYQDYKVVDQKSWDRKRGAPLRDLVFAELVESKHPEDKDTYLVTLICGHKVYTGDKKAMYPCLECAPWTSPPATPARLDEMVERGVVTEAPIPDEVVKAQAQQIADDIDKGFERQVLGVPVPIGQVRGVDHPCEKCGALKGSHRDRRGFDRCNACGYPGQ